MTDIRHHNLQAITDADIAAEGIVQGELGYGTPGSPGSWRPTPVEAFAALWDRLHENPDAQWMADPPVVAITFRLLEPAAS